MSETIQALVPSEWQNEAVLLLAPLAWLPDAHAWLLNFAWYGDTVVEVLFRRTLLLMPVLVGLVVLWATMLSLYTLPFRANRGSFVAALLLSWWDMCRSVWLFWAGLVRVAFVSVGWVWGTIRVGVRVLGAAIKRAVHSPFLLLDWTSRSYFKPGVPWVAFMALMVWSAIEATIFMYTLRPTLNEVLAGITGYEPNPALLAPILWLFLFFLVMGSFACIQVLAEAVRHRRVAEIIQMSLVEFFVMFFEVIFLYREMVDAISPWIAQQTNEAVQLGLGSTLFLASFGWVGVRGMSWFLFGRFGTPAVLAVLARDTIRQEQPEVTSSPALQPMFADDPIRMIKAEAQWFKQEAHEFFELVSLPVLQLLAAAVNVVFVVIRSQPMFKLPFANLEEALAASPLWSRSGKPPKRIAPANAAAVPPGAVPQGSAQ
jgi:hypothetical protein